MIFNREPSGICRVRRAFAFRGWRRLPATTAIRRGILAAAALACSLGGGVFAGGQNAAQASPAGAELTPFDYRAAQPSTAPEATRPEGSGQETADLSKWQGRPVKSISFEGVDASRLEPLPGHLAQAEGTPLDPNELKTSLRQLFATGLYEDIQVEASALEDGVALVFVLQLRSMPVDPCCTQELPL